MGLPWVRVDTNIFRHPKLVALLQDNEHRAAVLHLQAMCYSAEYDLAGFVPEACLQMLTCASDDAQKHCSRDAQLLLDSCLWIATPGGYTINGWLDTQFTSEQAIARSDKARKAAKARWANRNGSHEEDNDAF